MLLLHSLGCPHLPGTSNGLPGEDREICLESGHAETMVPSVVFVESNTTGNSGDLVSFIHVCSYTKAIHVVDLWVRISKRQLFYYKRFVVLYMYMY